MNEKFIITNNPESASILRRMGFQIINENGKTWIFMNDKKIIFQKIDDVVFSNRLYL